jgi:FAD synthetase
MSLEKLVSKYIGSAQKVFEDIQLAEVSVNLDPNIVKEVLETAKCYLADAKHYMEKGKFEVSLTSVAYCEGLLDALRMLKVVRFEWPTKRRKN